MSQFKLGVIIPVFGRERLTKIVLEHYLLLRVRYVNIVYIILASLDDPAYDSWIPYTEYNNWYVETLDNKPLSDKFNRGLRLLTNNFALDAVSVFGSDDLVNVSYIREAANRIRNGYDYVSASGINFFDISSKEMFYTRSLNVGACSLIATRVLPNFNGDVFVPGRDAGVDTQFKNRCRRYRIEKVATVDVSPFSHATLVDIKTPGENINNYQPLEQVFKRKSIPIDARAYFDNYFPGTYEQL